MIIRMKQQMSGGRHDGKPWPPPYTPFEVPDWEGRDLILGGMADPHGQDAAKVSAELREQPTKGHPSKLDERAADEPAETEPAPELRELAGAVADGESGVSAEAAGQAAAEAPEDPALPGDAAGPTPASAKQAWIDYAVSQGADVHAVSQMTKADLMSRFGGRL